jgi:hypothetical protein
MNHPHVLHHLRDEHVVMATTYGVATPFIHDPVGTAVVTGGYLLAAVLVAVARREPHAERLTSETTAEACTGRHAVCRYVA